MAAPLNVDREQVRMLVLSVGVREAARQCGISENTVLAWSNRGGWLQHITKPEPIERPASMQGAIVAIKPADALQNTLAELGNRTKLAAMKYAAKTTEHAAELDAEEALAAANDMKAVVQTAAIAGSWQSSTGTQVNIALLLGGSEV